MVTRVVSAPTASTAGVPYIGSLALEPSEMTNYDYFAVGTVLTASGLGVGERAVITDTAPSGEVYTFDPVLTDETGSVTTTVRRSDRVDPEVGMHRIEITSANGAMAGALLHLTLSERLNAEATATPSRLSADEFHDQPLHADGSGFLPGEWVSAHITLPDGTTGLLDQNLQADENGKVGYVMKAGAASVDPGPWQLTFLGMKSSRNGFANFFVTPSPDDQAIGTILLPQKQVTVSDFDGAGLSYSVQDMPAFGLYDVTLRDAVGVDFSVGRYRANGDGVFTGSIVSSSASAGHYRLSVVNADTNDYVRSEFTVAAADGAVPAPHVLTISKTETSPLDLMSQGLTVSGGGFGAGEIVGLQVRDFYRQELLVTSDSVLRKQADENGDVSFLIHAKDTANPGTWDVTMKPDMIGHLTLRGSFTVTGAPADGEQPGTSASPSPAPSGTGTSTPSAPAPTGIVGADALSMLTGLKDASSWFVQTTGEGALKSLKTPGRSRGTSPLDVRAQSIRQDLDQIVDAAVSEDENASVLYEAVYTVPGVAMHMTAQAAAALTERSDVVRVTPIVSKRIVEPVSTGAEPSNTASDALTGALKTWTTGQKYTGEGENIAIIDTGLDYTHTDFGGPGGGGRAWAEVGRDPSRMPAADSGLYDPNVVLPGHDFAGAYYNAETVQVPDPDDNPIDGPGGDHGTHVAGTAAGRGVNSDGTTFTGDYTTLTTEQVEAMKIGPGSAPGAKLIPLKVFGDFGGSTDLAGAALEWVGAHIAAGEKIDVVNMSLGSSFTSVDDPENALVDSLVDNGVVVVISAGNSGDVTDIAGSPGNAVKSLAVAASASGEAQLDGVDVYAPAEIAGLTGGQFSQDYPFWFDNTAPVVALTTSDLTGCTAYTAEDRERIAGKMVWLEWNEERLAAGKECGSTVRFDNAVAAGAVGVLMTSTLDRFEAGIAGNADIPGAQLTAGSTARLRPALEAGTLVTRLASSNAKVIGNSDWSLADTLATFSSRGVHGSIDGVVKPDLAAPGVNIVSAGKGTGEGAKTLSGTSMAAPHTAGIAALTREAHPDWSAERIKNVLMNTATHDVTDTDGVVYSPLRQGTGRVDALQATQAHVTVASVENDGLVTASFGVVEVAADGVTATRTLRLTNDDDTDHVYAVGYTERTRTPGAAISLDAQTVTVPANGTAEVTVTLSIADREALRRSIDPGQNQSTQTHIADISGVVTFSPTDGTSPLWVSVFAAPKPVSSVTAEDVTLDGGVSATAPLNLSGTTLDQGTDAERYQQRVTPLVVGATSDRIDFSDSVSRHSLEGVDVLRTGAASSAPQAEHPSQGRLAVGVQMAGPTIGLGVTSYPMVMVDANRDGRDDFVIYPRMTPNGEVTVQTYDNGTQLLLDTQPLNGLNEHRNQFDNDTIVVTAALASMGYTDTTKATAMSYRVFTISQYSPITSDGSRTVDISASTVFDVFTPQVSFLTGDDMVSAGPEPIEVKAGSVGAGELMLIAHDNASGNRVSLAHWSTSTPVTTTGLEVTTMPAKTHYAIGATFDPTGMTVSAVRSDGSRHALESTAYTVTGFDSSAAGVRELQVAATIDGTTFTTWLAVMIDAGGAVDPTPAPAGGGAPGIGTTSSSGHGASSTLAVTGGTFQGGVLLGALLLLIIGTGLVMRSRRNN